MSAVARAMGAEPAAEVATALKALADPLRLRMLSLIATSPTGEVSAHDLAEVADVGQPTVSHHLKVLRDVGVVVSQRRATWVFYRIAPQARRTVTALLEAFAPDSVTGGGAARDEPVLAPVDADLDRVAGALTTQWAQLSPSLVSSTVRESYVALARQAGPRERLLATTEQFARQRLADLVRADLVRTDLVRTALGAAGGPRPPQVLFVCLANAARSQLAAALLRRHGGDAVVARSAGSTPGRDIHATVRPILTDLTSTAEQQPFPKPLTDDAVRAADVVVTLGCGDTCPVLPGRRYEDWTVGDPALASEEGVRAIRDDLEARVLGLLAELGIAPVAAGAAVSPFSAGSPVSPVSPVASPARALVDRVPTDQLELS